jgi:hypothetical protein
MDLEDPSSVPFKRSNVDSPFVVEEDDHVIPTHTPLISSMKRLDLQQCERVLAVPDLRPSIDEPDEV